MSISLVSGFHALPDYSNREFQGRGFTRVVAFCSSNYETCYQRMIRVRQIHSDAKCQLHSYDEILGHPERFKSCTLRGLIHASRVLEELGENIADISGLTERATRNLISSGEKFDMAKVMSSAAGRIVSAQLSMLGFALHKGVGASLYALSSIISVGVLAYASSRHAKLRTANELDAALAKNRNSHSLYLSLARKLLAIKENQIEKLLRHTTDNNHPSIATIRRWAKRLSRNHRANPEYMVNRRKAHSSYILNNLHQYGGLTRGLMQFSYFTFQGVNKLLVSFDKHIGTAIGRKLLAKQTGELLSCRFALTGTIAASAAISVPMAPLVVGISTAGAIACGVALIALLLAKANVNICDDWKGNICDPTPVRSLAM